MKKMESCLEKCDTFSSIRRTLSDIGFSLLEKGCTCMEVCSTLDERLDTYCKVFGENTYKASAKNLYGEMIGFNVECVSKGSDRNRIVDEVYFRQPYEKLIKDLGKNVYQIKDYKGVRNKALEMAEEDLNQAAFFLSYYTAPRTCFKNGKLRRAKVNDIFKHLGVAKGILLGEPGACVKVREYFEDSEQIYILSKDRLIEISEPTFFDRCHPFNVSVKRMFASFKEQHPDWDNDKFKFTRWYSEYKSCVPLYEKFGDYGVLFMTAEQKEKLSEKLCIIPNNKRFPVRGLRYLEEIDELFVLRNGKWSSETIDKNLGGNCG